MDTFDVTPDVLWLDRFGSRRALRNLGTLRLFLCSRPGAQEEQAVLVGRIGADAVQVRHQLDTLATAHGALDHPWIAALDERGNAGDMEFVSFRGAVVDDLESLLAWAARKNLPPGSYAAGEGLALGLLDAFAHAHARGQQLGRLGPSNIVVSRDGSCRLFGFGATLERPAPGDAPRFEAPAQAASLSPAERDLCSWAACLRAYRRFFERPTQLDRALRGQAVERAQQWLADSVATLEGTLLSGEPLEAGRALRQLRQRHERLRVADPAEAWSSMVQGLLSQVGAEQKGQAERGVQGHGERYQFEGPLGEGSTSTVHKAWDRQLRQHVAIKRLSPGGSAESVLRLLREVRTLREVRHPQLVRGYELYEDRGQIGAVMEYIPGPTLREALVAHSLSGEQTREALSQVADALAELHRTGIVHRDVKPDNIILSGARGAVLVDFGVATSSARVGQAATATLTDPGRVLGERSYQAPELLAGGPATRASDVYSLACTVCEALRLERDANALAGLHEPLRTRLVQALSADMKQRPSSVEFAAALRAEPQAPAQRCVALDGRALQRADGTLVDLSRRSVLRRVLAALAQAHHERPGSALSRAQLFEAGWPDERIDDTSAANRVYVTIAELRKLGLKGVLESDGEGYLLTPAATRTVPELALRSDG